MLHDLHGTVAPHLPVLEQVRYIDPMMAVAPPSRLFRKRRWGSFFHRRRPAAPRSIDRVIGSVHVAAHAVRRLEVAILSLVRRRGPSPSGHLRWHQAVLSAFEYCSDALAVALRGIESVAFGLLIAVALSTTYFWWIRGTRDLPEVVRLLSERWQTALLVIAILLAPTIRDLISRIRELPGGTKLDAKTSKSTHFPPPEGG